MTPAPRRPRLVVLTGPIAAGKSTVARQLTDRLLADGLSVATVDVDDVAEMVQAPGGRTVEHWQQAHLAHGGLVGGWLGSAVEVVIAHGPIYTRTEHDALMSNVPAGTAVLRVLLLCSVEAALRRVAGEPGRGLSRNSGFLRQTYDRFWSLRAAIEPCDLTFDTQHTSPELIAAQIAASRSSTTR